MVGRRGDATTRDGDITVSAEKRIYDVSESQAKSSVSSSVSISCNVDGSFVGVAQINGTADTGVSAFLANSYSGIASSGIPDTLSTRDLDKYQGKAGNKNKTAYVVVRLPGVNSSLLYSGIKRHGVLLNKGVDVFGLSFFSKQKDLDFDESASTVKQKKVGATDADIIVMFSPYAAASGSAQNNAGQGIGNQVPSASADTSMEGQTTTHIADGSGGSSGSSSPVVSPTPTTTTPTPATLSASLSASSSSVSPYESVSFDLTTTTAFSTVYWYVAGPGASGLGSNVKTDYGGSSSYSASLSYSFSGSGDYTITAYIYNYSDSSIYQSSHTVSVSGGSSVSSDDTPNCQDCTSHCSSPCSCSNSGTCNGTVTDDTPNCSDCTSHCSSPCSCSNSGTCNGTVSTPSTPPSSKMITCSAGHSYRANHPRRSYLDNLHRVRTCRFSGCSNKWQACVSGWTAPLCNNAYRQARGWRCGAQ